jgi:hypothetical protein
MIHQRQRHIRAAAALQSEVLTPTETETLRALLAREAAPTSQHAGELAAGDVVQILPAADRAFGGMLAQITQAKPYQLRAVLLRPHRGGCRDAWLRLKLPEVARIGAAPQANPEFARRCEWRGPGCRYAP